MIGESLGRYRIVDRIGEGELGTVYRAFDGTAKRIVAIRVFTPELSADLGTMTQLFADAHATSALQHPALMTAHDYGVLGSGCAYLVVDFLEGETLATRLRRGGALPVSHALDLGRQLASGLAVTHAAGVCHLDLKLDTIFLVPSGNTVSGLSVRILDFGVNKLVRRGAAGGEPARAGIMPGSPACRSPEQCRGTGPIDKRADIYSVGCVLYALCCGRPPFVHDGWGALIGAHLLETPPSIADISPHVPAALESIIFQALAKDPAQRQSSMTELSTELSRLRAQLPAQRVRRLSPAETHLSLVPDDDTELTFVPPTDALPQSAGQVLMAAGGAAAQPSGRAMNTSMTMDRVIGPSSRIWSTGL